MGNEATFEAQLGALLQNIFPATGIQVTHQVQFTLRLGHHDIRVDGRKGWEKKGRADIVLSTEAGHVAILELKRPGMELTDEDRDQGLSYARLLTPMPPLVLVSNGTTNKFYRTIDATPWTPTNIDDEVFAKLVVGAAALAANDRDEAIRSLLGSNPTVWADYLRQHTADALARRTGELHDVSFPLAQDFSVERSMVTSILGRLRKHVPAVALVGPPLSGKSVVLKQCCDRLSASDLVPLYIDASSARQGPLRLLASVFARNLFSATSLDHVRQWLTTSLRAKRGDTRLVLFLDEILPELNDTWLGDLDELLVLGVESPISIVLGLDPNTWQALEMRPGRPTKTELGQRAEVLYLRHLSDREFDSALQRLFETTRSQPYHGGRFNPEYREPRVLRAIADLMPRPRKSDEGTMVKFPSTSTLGGLDLAWNAFVGSNPDLADALRSLARAYLSDLATPPRTVELQLASYNAAAIRKDIAANLLPPSTLKWLLDHSFLSTRLGPDEEVLLLPRHLELFARATALELGKAVAEITEFDIGYTTLMQRSDMLPLGDIVGAGALRVVSERAPELCSHIIGQALADSPKMEDLPAGSTMEVSFFGKNLGTFTTPEPSTLTGNIHPWLVLAQVAMLPLESVDQVSPNGRIIARVGTFPGLLRRFGDARWPKLEGFHVHEFPGKGSVPCLSHGVVESLGQAIIMGFHARPSELVSMSEHAVSEGLFHLAWRLNTAAREVTSATDQSVAEAAEATVTATNEFFREYYAELLHEQPEGGTEAPSGAS